MEGTQFSVCFQELRGETLGGRKAVPATSSLARTGALSQHTVAVTRGGDGGAEMGELWWVRGPTGDSRGSAGDAG